MIGVEIHLHARFPIGRKCRTTKKRKHFIGQNWRKRQLQPMKCLLFLIVPHFPPIENREAWFPISGKCRTTKKWKHFIGRKWRKRLLQPMKCLLFLVVRHSPPIGNRALVTRFMRLSNHSHSSCFPQYWKWKLKSENTKPRRPLWMTLLSRIWY